MGAVRWSSLASLALGFGLLVAGAGCDRSACEQTCRRVAECKREKIVGERVPGDSVPGADPACMARCDTEQFAACEGKKRECSAVLDCIPYR